MSRHHLGEVFDIHGGGLDLIFPHHENEIAQSRCAHGTETMAKYWLHNGYLQVEGRKMSKSEGNFVTIHDLLHTEKFGGRKWPGEVLRLAMLMTHYREPIDFSVRKLEEAENILRNWQNAINVAHRRGVFSALQDIELSSVRPEFLSPLMEDLDTARAVQVLSGNLKWLVRIDDNWKASTPDIMPLLASLVLLGFEGGIDRAINPELRLPREQMDRAIDRRLSLLREKNFAEADRIREELAAQGIQLMDYKDPETGERRTKWEVKR
jgi:cysteinyl-tRNA synthetase